MIEHTDPNTKHSPLSRRDALVRALTCGLAALSVPASAREEKAEPPVEEFVPENDYPYFFDTSSSDKH